MYIPRPLEEKQVVYFSRLSWISHFEVKKIIVKKSQGDIFHFIFK